MKEKKKYSREFKLDAISLVKDQGYTRMEAAKSLGIDRQLIGRWIKSARLHCIILMMSHK